MIDPAFPVVGEIDDRGYLRCLPCAQRHGIGGEPVRYAPHRDEPCDVCLRVVKTTVPCGRPSPWRVACALPGGHPDPCDWIR